MVMDRADLYKLFQDRYLNKIEIGFRLPGEFSLPTVWQEIQQERISKAEVLALRDEKGGNFWYVNTKPLQAKLHQIDSRGKDSLISIVRREIEDEVVVDSTIEEAYATAAIEGALSTSMRANELVRHDLNPIDKSELMIKNNYQSLKFILENRGIDFSIDFILKLHRIITLDTLENTNFCGKFRNDDVAIWDNNGTIVFKPMPFISIIPSLQILINWVNFEKEEDFIHPIVKASIIHFYIAYVHPFFDGNGRTARALFYFYLLNNGYDFLKYFSISSHIVKQRAIYYKAFRDVEDHDNDLTYFLIYSSDIILKSIDEITDKIIKKYKFIVISSEFDRSGIILNKRQNKLLKLCIEQEIKSITTRKYQKIFRVSYGTARSDLNELVDYAIFKKRELGKGFVYDINLKAFLTWLPKNT
jgi:Fic family protein